MPAKSADQYGLAVATLGGAATQMPLKVAEEIVRKTPKAARMRFAKELAKRRGNPKEPLRWPEDRDTAQFYKYLLHIRNSPSKLKFVGFTRDEVDTMLSAMNAGATKKDALYRIGRLGNPSPLTSAMIEGAGFAAGNAIASPLIEIGKEVVRRGFGMRKGNPTATAAQRNKFLSLIKQLAYASQKGVKAEQNAYEKARAYADKIGLDFGSAITQAIEHLKRTSTSLSLQHALDNLLRYGNPGSLAQANPRPVSWIDFDEDPNDRRKLKAYYNRHKKLVHEGSKLMGSYAAGLKWAAQRLRGGATAEGDYPLDPDDKTLEAANYFEAAAKYKQLYPSRNLNPGTLEQAEQLSEQFHGRPVEADYYEDDILEYDSKLADIGELIELSLWTGKKGYDLPITFNHPRPRLASSADGQQLYIVGGDQSLDNASLKALEKVPVYHDHVGTNRSKRKIPLGTLVVIAYKTDKHHLKGASGGQDAWEHHFGEETSKAPMLVYDTLNRKMEIVGGDYQVKDVGIVN